jgi:SAM-dependent methyltransferase
MLYMEKEKRKNVYKVYNKIGNWFAENRYAGLQEKSYLDDLLKHIPPHASVLDLGCGNGKPILEYLIKQGVNVLGIDASEQMLEIAKVNFPTTRFMLKDMRKLDLDEKFDAIIAWHSFFIFLLMINPICLVCLKIILILMVSCCLLRGSKEERPGELLEVKIYFMHLWIRLNIRHCFNQINLRYLHIK